MMAEKDTCIRNKKTIYQETGETKKVSQAATALNSKRRRDDKTVYHMEDEHIMERG